MRVSPQLVAVWAYRFKHESREFTGTLGEVLTLAQPSGLTFEEACTAFAAAKDEAINPRPRHTLAWAYADWLANHRNRRTGGALAPRTAETYAALYERNLSTHAHAVLEETPPRYWRDVLQSIRDRAPHQARQTAILLQSIHGHLVNLKELPENPITPLMPSFNGRDLKTARKGHVPVDALPAFFAAVNSLRVPYRLAPLMLALTGWRMGAVLRMRWSELDLEAGGYTVPKRGEGWKGYEGVVALADVSVELLRKRKAEQKAAGKPSPWVFPARHGERGHQVDVSDSVERAGAAAGVELSPHDLRRTFSTAAQLAGIDALTISRLTGHKHATTAVAPEHAWTPVGASYVMAQLRVERAAANQVAELLLELGDVWPMSDETKELMTKKGLRAPGAA